MLNQIDLSRTDLNLLALFEIVLEERHVGRAAERLRLSPSAVSHGLGRLRRLLNDPLFLRTPKGVVPTARATELSEPIADILARARNVISTAAPFDAARSTRRFTIGSADGFSIFLPALMAELERTAPNIDIVMRHMQRESAISDLDARAIDVAVAPFDDVPGRLFARALYQEEFVVAAHRGHPFLDAPTLARYCEMRHLMIAPRGDPRGPVDDLLLSQHGLSRRVVLAVPNFMLGLDVISKTDLISMLPKRFVAMHAERFGIAWAQAPLSIGLQPVLAVAPKVAMMDAGIAWLFDALARAAGIACAGDRRSP
jgi:DNA-binding transcriptional LysR family regulator